MWTLLGSSQNCGWGDWAIYLKRKSGLNLKNHSDDVKMENTEPMGVPTASSLQQVLVVRLESILSPEQSDKGKIPTMNIKVGLKSVCSCL